MAPRFTRRSFSSAAALTAATVALKPAWSHAQTPAASPAATPQSDLFAGLAFEQGKVETGYGVIEFPENISRIVVLDDGPLDAVLTLGADPVGYTVSSNFETAAAYLADKVPADATSVGGWGELDLEAIIMLEPDIILSLPYHSDEEYATLSAIASVVAPAFDFPNDPEPLQKWELETLTFAHVLNKLDEAKALILEQRARAVELAGRAGERSGQSVVVFRPQPEFPVIMSQHWITGVTLSWCGFVGNELTESMDPPHSGDTISLEQLNLMEADWLLAAARTDDMAEALAGYESNPSFQTITAYQDDHVELVSGDLWSGATGVLACHALMDDIERILIDG